MSAISKVNFVVAAVLFAVFLFAFRSLVWRRILKRFGYRIPIVPAVRIWSASEIARYIPGAIMQVAGRVYLVKPYGVPGSVCAASQMLELITFLMANLLVGFSCLVVFGFRHIHGEARLWIYGLAVLVPALALLLHPRIFYGLTNRIMRRLKKPALTKFVSGYELTRLLLWNIAGIVSAERGGVFDREWAVGIELGQMVCGDWGLQPGMVRGICCGDQPRGGWGCASWFLWGSCWWHCPNRWQDQFARGGLKSFLIFSGRAASIVGRLRGN